MKRMLLLTLLATPLAGCGAATAVETRVQIEKVPVPAPCPNDEDYAGIVAGRPVPLRDTPMPADPDVRVAKAIAQLGRYEAKGGWADQAMAIIDRCHAAGS